MKRILRSRLLVLVVLCVMVMQIMQCGFIIYPERRNRGPAPANPGQIDPVILIMDCAWLLVGIIPGVVALVVDVTTGCLYESGGKASLHPGDKMAFRMKGRAPADANVEVVLQQRSGDRNITKLLERNFSAGEETRDSITIAIPQTVETGKYELALKVDGITNASWDITVTP